MSQSLKVIFMGTPDFAVLSLAKIKESGIEIAGVITAPDKPAGRGKKNQASAVKEYSVRQNIQPILQPANLKDETFLDQLRELNADLFIVVAFRMLPEVVWRMPKFGTINLHASLLPQYRGAAPINWAIINGEKKTGVTTFFIEKEIDTGNIIRQQEVEILPDDTAGSLHDKLMHDGAELLTDTILNIQDGCYEAIMQKNLIGSSELKPAPKIFKEDCKINWENSAENIYNFIRGLSPYPCAWTEFYNGGKDKIVFKIYFAEIEKNRPNSEPGTIIYTNKTVKVACADGYINIKLIQQAGKKRMDTEAFLRGFNEKDKYTVACF